MQPNSLIVSGKHHYWRPRKSRSCYFICPLKVILTKVSVLPRRIFIWDPQVLESCFQKQYDLEAHTCNAVGNHHLNKTNITTNNTSANLKWGFWLIQPQEVRLVGLNAMLIALPFQPLMPIPHVIYTLQGILQLHTTLVASALSAVCPLNGQPASTTTQLQVLKLSLHLNSCAKVIVCNPCCPKNMMAETTTLL